MSKPNVIIVDVHEPNTLIDRIKACGYIVEIQPLQAGDIIIGNAVVERKEIGDFFNTLRGGRLFDQMYKLKQTGMRPYLSIIGNYPSRKMKISIPRMQQQIKSIAMTAFNSYGVLVTKHETEEMFIKDFLDWLWQRATVESYPPQIKKSVNAEDIKVDIIGAVPGFGPKLAKELCGNFTIKQLMEIPEEELRNYQFGGRKLGKKADKWLEVREL